MAPYTAFVRGEERRLSTSAGELQALRQRLEGVKRDLNAHFKTGQVPGA